MHQLYNWAMHSFDSTSLYFSFPMSSPINVAFLSIHGDAHSSSSSNYGDIE